jgi:hypothetical protein
MFETRRRRNSLEALLKQQTVQTGISVVSTTIVFPMLRPEGQVADLIADLTAGGANNLEKTKAGRL